MTIVNETLILNNLMKEESFETFGEFSDFIKENLDSVNFLESFTLKKNYDNYIKKFNKRNKDYEIKLSQMGIDVKSFKTLVRKNALATCNELRNLSVTKDGIKKGSKLIEKKLVETKETVIDTIVNSLADFLEGTDSAILSSAIIVLMIISINTFMAILLTFFFGPPRGLALTAVIVAPITEEIGKLTAIRIDGRNNKKREGLTYNIVFNVTEFYMYAAQLLGGGASLGLILKLRVPAIIMHTVNQLLLRFGYKRDIAEGKDKDVAGTSGLVVTMAIHSIFNFVAVITSKM